MGKLDNPEYLKRIINRLPYGIRIRWRDTVDQIVEKGRRDVTTEDVTKFVTTKARAANHSIFGKVDRERKEKTVPGWKRSCRPGFHADGFAIHSEEGRETTTLNQAKGKFCPLCKHDHWLSGCERFRKQSLDERRKLVKEKLCRITAYYLDIMFILVQRKVSARSQNAPRNTRPFFMHHMFLKVKTNLSNESSRMKNPKIGRSQLIMPTLRCL